MKPHITPAQARKLGIVPKRKRGVKVAKVLQGEPTGMVMLELPWPPGSNNAYPTVGNRRVLSKEGKDYKRAVGLEVIRKNRGHVVGRIDVRIWCYPPDDRKFDLDGKLKIVLDSLTEAGVWGDDSQIDSLAIYRITSAVLPKNCIRLLITGDDPK